MSTFSMPEPGKPNGLSDDTLLQEVKQLLQQSEILIARSQFINRAINWADSTINHFTNSVPALDQQDNNKEQEISEA